MLRWSAAVDQALTAQIRAETDTQVVGLRVPVPSCLRCGMEIPAADLKGCVRHICQSCQFLYPQGDCSER